MRDLIYSLIEESTEAKKYLLQQSDAILKAAKNIYSSLKQGNKLLVFGNGGSAADAQHISAELLGRFKRERNGLAAIALTTDTSFLTAWSNDRDFETVFERQVEALAKPKDVLWGISTSGMSENVLRAFEKGRKIGTYNFSLTGRDGGNLRELSDLNINIPLDNTARIQEAHQLTYHIICEIIEEYAFKLKN